jgi:hypothetical protein
MTLHESLLVQSRACASLGSSIYEQVFVALADDLKAGGVVADITAGMTIRPGRDAAGLRIAGALHREVLAGRAPLLARHFPSAGGQPGDNLIADYLTTLRTHEEAVRDGLERTVQTNEVGRTTMLATGMAFFAAALDLPGLHLREVGSSCGLNLNIHKFFFANDTGTYGDRDSPVRFEHDSWGTPQPNISRCPSIISRRGCDIAPLDARAEEDRLTLLSFVWPDQDLRFTRLRAALDIADSSVDYEVPDTADAARWIDEQFSNIASDEPVLIFHSIAWQYFSQETKDHFRDVFAQHAQRRTSSTAWLRMEPRGPIADLRIDMWNTGIQLTHDHILATSSYHGLGTRAEQ